MANLVKMCSTENSATSSSSSSSSSSSFAHRGRTRSRSKSAVTPRVCMCAECHVASIQAAWNIGLIVPMLLCRTALLCTRTQLTLRRSYYVFSFRFIFFPNQRSTLHCHIATVKDKLLPPEERFAQLVKQLIDSPKTIDSSVKDGMTALHHSVLVSTFRFTVLCDTAESIHESF